VCFDLQPKEPCFALFIDVAAALILASRGERPSENSSESEFVRIGVMNGWPTKKENLKPGEWNTVLKAEDLEEETNTVILF